MKNSIKPVYICLVAIVIFAGFHFYRVDAPPNGKHYYREAHTASMALNFYQEDMTIYLARTHDRGAGSGITGAEFQFYTFLTAIIYHITGPYHYVLHLLSLIAGCLGIWFSYKIISFISNDLIGALASWGVAFSPTYFYYSFKIMPTVTMLALSLIAVYSYLLFTKERKILWLVLAFIFMIMAGTIKPLVFAVFLPLLIYEYKLNNKNYKWLGVFITYCTLVVAFCVLFFMIQRIYINPMGKSTFDIDLYFHRIIPDIISGGFPYILIIKWPIEIWFGWLLAPAFFYGAYKAWISNKSWFLFTWIIGCYIIFIITSLKSTSHDYYTIIAVIPFAGLTGIGLYSFWKNSGWQKKFAIILLCLSPVWAFYRISHRFGPDLDFNAIRNASEQQIPREDLVIVDDRIPIYRLYQMNRNGWSLLNRVTHERISGFINEGAKFLVLKKTIKQYNEPLDDLVEESPTMIGPLYCYKVREQ
jgi:dolichyl-phosphate-mannose-protein mannosyltransferase